MRHEEALARIVALEAVVASQRDSELMKERDRLTRRVVALEQALGVANVNGGFVKVKAACGTCGRETTWTLSIPG